MQTFIRVAPSLGAFEKTPQEAWGLPTYRWPRDRNETLVACGLYDARDYLALFLHRGKRYIFWCGQDIVNLKKNFLLNDGKLKTLSRAFSGFPRLLDSWIAGNCESWCENETEAAELRFLGIASSVCPSFFGNANAYACSFFPKRRACIYASAGQGRAKEYGFDLINSVAARLPWCDFHLYGDDYACELPNVYVHGRVPQAVFAEETSKMQIALSLNDFCGFSEVVARGILRGQYAVSKVPHPLVPSFMDEMELVMTLNRLSKMTEPNHAARNWYRENLNRFPFNANLSKSSAP